MPVVDTDDGTGEREDLAEGGQYRRVDRARGRNDKSSDDQQHSESHQTNSNNNLNKRFHS